MASGGENSDGEQREERNVRRKLNNFAEFYDLHSWQIRPSKMSADVLTPARAVNARPVSYTHLTLPTKA